MNSDLFKESTGKIDSCQNSLFSSEQNQKFFTNLEIFKDDMESQMLEAKNHDIDPNLKYGYYIEHENLFVQCSYLQYSLIKKYLKSVTSEQKAVENFQDNNQLDDQKKRHNFTQENEDIQ